MNRITSISRILKSFCIRNDCELLQMWLMWFDLAVEEEKLPWVFVHQWKHVSETVMVSNCCLWRSKNDTKHPGWHRAALELCSLSFILWKQNWTYCFDLWTNIFTELLFAMQGATYTKEHNFVWFSLVCLIFNISIYSPKVAKGQNTFDNVNGKQIIWIWLHHNLG